MTRVVVLMMVGLAACAAPKKKRGRAPLPPDLVEAERAYTLGDPFAAAGLVPDLAASDPQRARAEELRDTARAAIEVLTHDWLDKARGLLDKRQYYAARIRVQYLLDDFPLDSAARAEAEALQREIERDEETARNEVEDLEGLAKEHLLRNDIAAAIDTLRRAEALARKIDPHEALRFEQTIAAAELRLEGSSVARRGRLPPRKKPAEPGLAATETPVETVSPADTAKLAVIQELLKAADRHEKRKAYYEAILAYEKVLAPDHDPTHATAKTALAALESKRKALIQEYMDRANALFLKQDLAGAAPYYRKVRDLDPNNEEAREGLRMYENLERIRKGRGR
ncbi:MAG: hypothetical protein HYZ27_08905 [Deltaproteobacteria bacterium]|nr:hypothetical protein [Deltaproteobacteria bacterium]